MEMEKMNMEIITESAAIYLDHPCPECREIISWEQLRNSKIGTRWDFENQDCFPNRTTVWDERWTVIYKSDSGAAILHESDESGQWRGVSIEWYGFAKPINEEDAAESDFWLSALKDADKSMVNDENLRHLPDNEYIAERRKRAAAAILKFYHETGFTGQYKG